MENNKIIIKNLTKPFIITMALVIYSCNPQKTALSNPIAESDPISITRCPDDGKCTIQIFRNKKLEVKIDEIGAAYYQMSDNSQTSVILYQYNRNVEKGIQDAHYTEEIIFEINNADSGIMLSDLDLQKTKMLFGRLCFCRGQTGYYKVLAGNLELKQKNNEIKLNLDFKITQVPQIINSITASLK